MTRKAAVCKRGHVLAGRNLKPRGDGRWRCRACTAISNAAYVQRRRAKIVAADPLGSRYSHRSLEARFRRNVNVDGPTVYDELGPCSVWTAATRYGYGVLSIGNNRIRVAHRVAFFLANGRWPTKHLLHRCDNRPCVRLDHLFEGTDADNVADMMRKGRYSGPDFMRSKLTVDLVRQIRTLREQGSTTREIAARYDLSMGCVQRVCSRRSWAWVP